MLPSREISSAGLNRASSLPLWLRVRGGAGAGAGETVFMAAAEEDADTGRFNEDAAEAVADTTLPEVGATGVLAVPCGFAADAADAIAGSGGFGADSTDATDATDAIAGSE